MPIHPSSQNIKIQAIDFGPVHTHVLLLNTFTLNERVSRSVITNNRFDQNTNFSLLTYTWTILSEGGVS